MFLSPFHPGPWYPYPWPHPNAPCSHRDLKPFGRSLASKLSRPGALGGRLCPLARAWKLRTDKKRDLFDTGPCQADSRSCGKVAAHKLNQFQSRISRNDSIDHQQAGPEGLSRMPARSDISPQSVSRITPSTTFFTLGGTTQHSG